MNFLPIVVRELRVTARKPATYWRRSLAALLLLSLFLFTAWGNSLTSASRMGQTAFEIMRGLALAACLLAGVFQTADCVSSEKREGTIGFLFLTDLRGYDVLFGKLVSNSLYSLYALLAALPVMALPLLVGGVSFGEFWRTVVILLDALFFSLAIGIFVSTISHESRQSFVGTLFIILLSTAILPGLGSALRFLLPTQPLPSELFHWPSLGYAIQASGDGFYHYRTGHREFWGCLGTVFAMGVLGLIIASVLLPRIWQEKARSSSSARGNWGHRIRFGSARRRLALRLRLLPKNPFYWLSVRDRTPRLLLRLLTAVALPMWLGSIITFWVASSSRTGWTVSAQQFMVIAMFTTFGFSLVFKTVVAIEATRRLNDDRRNGALELLLVTPLSVRHILAGLKRALWRQFWFPLATGLVFFLILFLVVTTNLRGSTMNDPVFPIMMAGNCVALLVDFWAIGWLGIWTGLRASRHDRAVVSVLGRILVLPWMLYLLMGLSGMLNTPNSASGFFVIWFTVGVALDIGWALMAYYKLRRHFRAVAAGLFGERRRRFLPPPKLEPVRV